MAPKIFVDGQEGTTGLRIHDYLAARNDVEVLKIDSDKRKDLAERKRLLNEADVVFLCLPDGASREAVALIENDRTKVIDASTAFRTDPGWAYGLPELSSELREKIARSKRVAVPGCHASAFLLPIYPLVKSGIISRDAQLTCFSLTGYSGGGKKMIASYEDSAAVEKLHAPRHYALTLRHKHLPEMQMIVGLASPPLFTPIVCDVHSGLAVEVFLPAHCFAKKTTPQQIHESLNKHYANEPFVKVLPLDLAQSLGDGFFDITVCNGTNRAEIGVFGRDEQIAVITRLDNLGKGAAGAAIQCLNLVLNQSEGYGLMG